MKDEKKSSIIKEALTDYNTIREAAETNAKKKLAEEYPDKFNKLLKEELQNKNKSTKESYKKLDEAQESKELDNNELNNESVMANQVKETKKVEETAGESKPFDKAAPKMAKVVEDVKITDTVGKGDPFKEKAKGAKKIEEGEKEFMGDVEAQTPNQGKSGEAEKGKVFNEKIKGPSSGKPITNLEEEFNITELDASSVDSTLGSALEEDEVFTMNEIEQEINAMQTPAPAPVNQGNGGDAYGKLMEMKKALDEMINSMGGGMSEMHAAGATDGAQTYGTQGQISRQHAEGPTKKLVDETGLEEMHAAGGETFGSTAQINALHNQGPTKKLVDEEAISDEDVNSVLGSQVAEQELEETKGVSFSAGTITPGKLGDNDFGTRGRFRQTDEAQKKIGSLIAENKNLTKKLNETKKYKESVGTLVEQYKSALDKYRKQLREMAIFNTNLAHVNNLLVNEELALTQEDKIKIINEFKSVDTIAGSQNKYKAFLTEMKGSKKTISESVEAKVSVSIQPSSKNKLDEVIEKTAYENNEHVNKMKKLIEYMNRGDKKIIKS